MAANYGQISQIDDDEDRNHGPSPSGSLSPAPSSSSMPFLQAVDNSFTPLSMDPDSEFDTSSAVQSNKAKETFHNTRTTGTAKHGGLSIGDLVESLSARATPPVKRNHANAEYDLLSPGEEAPLSSPSSPNPNTTLPSPDPGSTVDTDSAVQGNFALNSREHTSPNLPTSRPPAATEQPLDKSIGKQTNQQTILVRPKPLVRTASTKSVSLRHPTPDINTRSSSHASNIAQLEATAEQLSMTSSIEDAIRDLHDEQKRNDSRRSSILAASIGSIPETGEPFNFPHHISRQVSAASSILETNSAARLGGYSPAAYIMSPNHSLRSTSTRLRSGSNGLNRTEPEADTAISRHGPGKSSVRSAISTTKPTLTNIAEMEPTALTSAAMDEADRLAEMPEEEPLRVPRMEDVDLTPNAGQHHSEAESYWDQAVAEAHHGAESYDNRPASAGSGGTYEQAERAFADFDGAHCSPDADFEDSINFHTMFASPTSELEESMLHPLNPDGVEENSSRPYISRPINLPTVRPTSYLDPNTGDSMMFYPARVPMMLNLPQKLSKKPKAEVRNARRSQVLKSMPEANRQSGTSWLPEFAPQALMDPLSPFHDGPSSESAAGPSTEPEPIPVDERRQSQLDIGPDPQPLDVEARKSRLSVLDPGKRKSAIPDLAGLPPQLRASAFFDLPSESPNIQLKDGSATATLDSILDASAKAPVSAFTDHAFAGSLGSEVYGTDKKRKSHMKRASAGDLIEQKKRGSFFHLRKPSSLSRHSNSHEDRGDAVAADASIPRGEAEDEERQNLSENIDGGEDEEEEVEEDPVYDGPPTTLLAELQLRKHQQKLRTRPVATAFPNGMHSTLLELDTVAELERNARKGKRVNLAWEDPSSRQEDVEDDEDTPLALLAATKGQGLIGALTDLNRPPGLMEQREMEDNEPLSVRRNRLQGSEVGPIKRITLARGPNMSSVMLAPPSPALRIHTPEEDEDDGETLGARMRRLRAQDEAENPLPRARPVSSAFSAELFNQLGDTFKEEPQEKGKGKEKAQTPEEEETLGQRRQRLQAEREAREREMATMALTGGRLSVSPRLTKRHSLADVLGARNNSKTLLSDPRVDAETAKREEAARYQREQEKKFAALRSQMPANLSTPNLNKSGGYMSGRFNDGSGGGFGQPRNSIPMNGFGNNQVANPGYNASRMGNAYGMGGTMSTYGMPTGYGSYASPMQIQMQMQPGTQMNRVEQWRQSVFP